MGGMDDAELEMPWANIARVTAATAAIVGAGLTVLCAAAIRSERARAAEAARFRWSDANRWEK